VPNHGGAEDDSDRVEKVIGSAIREAMRIQHDTDAAVSRLMTVRDAATYLATSTTTVRTLAKSGAIRSAAIGEGLRFRRAWLDAWIDAGGGAVDRASSAQSARVKEVVVARRAPHSREAQPGPKKPKGPVPAATTPDGTMLYLLRSDPVSRAGISHYGLEARSPLCGREQREPLKVVSVEDRFWFGRDNANCRPCLNDAGHMLGSRIVELGLERVTMRTISRRGESVSVRQDGWHTGNGWTTWCGQKRSDWDLAFRSPGGSARRCLDCDERDLYLSQQDRAARSDLFYRDPLFGRGVLLDVGVEPDQFLAIARRAPEIFDIRQALVVLKPPGQDDFRPFSQQYQEAKQTLGTRRAIVPSYHPEIVVSSRLANLVPWPVYDEKRAQTYVRELVLRAERRKVLRAKWDHEKKRGSRGAVVGSR
jgi:excisionase family DNA binding protein